MSNLSFQENTAPGRSLCLYLFLVLVLMSGSTAFAGIVLDPIGQQEWERNSSPGGIQVTFGIMPNSLPPTDNLLNTFSVGIIIVTDAAQGAQGTLRIQAISAPTNPIFTQYSDLRFSGGTTQVVTGDNQTVSAGNNLPRNTQLTLPRNIFTALFTSPNNNAIGRFQIFAVPSLTTYFTETNFDGEKFSNAPDGAANVLLGSINVTAVPEPSSTLLVGLIVVGIATIRLQRSQRNRRTENSLRIV